MGLTSFPQKKRKIQIEKEVARQTRTQKINNTKRTIKKTVIGLTGRLQARSPTDR
jgi:hypothetical protein